MSGSRIAEVEAALAAERAAADERLVEALRQARRLEDETAARGAEAGRRRIAQLQAVGESVTAQATAVELAAARLATSLATVSERLAEIDAATEFRAPAWRSALAATVTRNLEPEA
jgi:hypothetical protein